MLRRHSVEGVSIVDVATQFGVSRPTVYQAQAAFQQAGLSGLLPKHRGPKEGHKLSAEIIEYVRTLRVNRSRLTTVAWSKPFRKNLGSRFTAAVWSGRWRAKKNRAIRHKIAHCRGNRRSLRRTAPTSGPTGRTRRTPRRARHSHALWLGSVGADPARGRTLLSTAIGIFHLRAANLSPRLALAPNSSVCSRFDSQHSTGGFSACLN